MLKYKAFIILFSAILITFSLSANPQQNKGKFIIEVEGLRNNNGNLRVALYDNEGNFLKDGGCYKKYVAEIKDGACVIETEPIPYGEYAIGIMHDENKNEKLDLNLIRLPKEGFGFSNNPTVRIKKPTFKETKIILGTPQQEVKIKTKYIL